MAGSFGQTMRALHADRSRAGGLAIAILAVLALGWIAWMIAAEVPVFETTSRARFEVLPAPSQVGAPIAGRVEISHLQVGARIAAGDALVELEAAAQRVELARARDQLAAFEPELRALERELAAEASATTAGDASGRAAVREQLARQRAADTELAHAEAELARLVQLAAGGAAPTMEVDRARTELAQKRAAREALGHAADALVAAERERDAGRRARTAELERQRAGVARTIAAARADIARLELELERHVVRAPVSGVLGSVAALQAGAMVAAGAPIATVVPDGTLQVVADYGPSSIGRLAPGQPARLKLAGFPWTRWGTVAARVARVASEVRDGAIRVELTIEPGPRIPLTHGMTGTVEVEVEQVSPATLVLRSLADRPAEAP